MQRRFFAALFLLLIVIARRRPAANAKVRRIETGLAVLFGLGSIRATLWAVGVTVAMANLIVFVIGIAGVVGFIAWAIVTISIKASQPAIHSAALGMEGVLSISGKRQTGPLSQGAG